MAMSKTIFKKGNIPWIKGKKASEETKQKMRLAHLGKPHYQSKETKINIGLANKGRKMSEEFKQKCRENKLGKTSPMKGKHHTQEAKEKMSMTHTNSEYFDGFHNTKNERLRHSFKFKQWRLEVFKRDNYTCQDCNKRGVTLHPHHIISVKECIRLNKIEEIFNVNNGLTLCVGCHLKKGLHKRID